MGDSEIDGGTDRAGTEIDEAALARDQVAALLAAAGLDPPDEEIERLAALYPGLRRTVDRFHRVEVGDGVTAAVFRAGEAS